MAVDVDARKLSPVADSDPDRPAGDRANDEAADIGDDEAEPTVSHTSDGSAAKPTALRPKPSRLTVGLMVGGLILVAVSALAGWFGYQMMHARQAQLTRELFLQTGRQAAINLTSIDYTHADADIKRVLDSATGEFADEFARNSAGFADIVRQAHAKSSGKVTESGVESIDGDSAHVLVAVAVTTTAQGADGQRPRLWRMRIALQKQDGAIKVSNVGFVQ